MVTIRLFLHRDIHEQLLIGLVGLGRNIKKHAENLAFKVVASNLTVFATSVEKRSSMFDHISGFRLFMTPMSFSLNMIRMMLFFLVTTTTILRGQIIFGLQTGKHVFVKSLLHSMGMTV
jgi:hypothetical protein